MVPSCPGTYMESYAGVSTTSQTVVFGSQGQAIYSGDVLTGYATNMSGLYPYSVQVAFSGCSETADTFSVSMTDSKNDHWTGSFSGTNQ
jgi:hypothetical protein